MSATVAIIDDELFDYHCSETNLPERPKRTKEIRKSLRDDEEVCNKVMWLSPEPITREHLNEVHVERYVNHVFETCEVLESLDDAFNHNKPISGDMEVLVSKGSLKAILCAAGASQQAVRAVLSTEDPTKDIERVFCNVRPPGHHAHRAKGQGYCIFNNVWLAACEARKQGAKRVAIVDWDVHHGNGTQDFVLDHEEEENTLFFSIHQDHRTIWPATGKKETKGSFGTVNCGEIMPRMGDDEVKEYFDNVLMVKLREFKPEIILISCGFDAHEKDYISNLLYSSEVYGWMTERLMEQCDKIVSILEGGYCIEALKESVIHHVKAMITGNTK